MYEYTWNWKGQTQKGHCKWTTRDGLLQTGLPFGADVENTITQTTREAFFEKVIGVFANKCSEQHITITLKPSNVQCTIEKDALIKQISYTGRGEHQIIVYDQPFIVKLESTIVFDTEQQLAGSPLLPAFAFIIYLVVLTIISIGIAYGIYEFVKNLTLNETSSEVTTWEYDTNGNLVKKTTEKTKTQKPATSDPLTAIVAVAALVLGAIVIVPALSEKRSGNGSRSRRRQ